MSKSSNPPETGSPILTAEVVAPPESRRTILLMLFVLMGALAIPMLWRSDHFEKPTKVILAILAGIQTTVAIGLIIWLIVWLIRQVLLIVGAG
jgi:hypothetical protein